jgi:DNA primase
MEIEKCSYIEAIKLLAERAQIRIPEPDDESYRKDAAVRDRVRESLVEAARYFYHHLRSPQGAVAAQYLERRKISPQTAKAFGLGYAPDDWSGLYRHLRGKGFTDDILSKNGLFTKGKKNDLLDLFRGRLMFPIFDSMGKIVAFGGRILGDGHPKYINSPESVVYSKQRHLYGLNFAKATREKKLIIVEGYMDVISMHQAGVTNAVASLGTALTDRQLDLASRYAEEIVLFYDSDNAGQAAALRGLQMLLERDKKHTATQTKISIAMVPDGKDPDEYIKAYGGEAFRDIVSNAYSVMDYLLLVAKRQSTTDGKFDPRTYQQLACTYISWEQNAVLRERAAGEVARTLRVSPASVLLEADRAAQQKTDWEYKENSRKTEKQTTVIPDQNDDNRANLQEIALLCLLTEIGSEYASLEEKPIPTDFTAGSMRDIATEAIKLLQENKLNAISFLDLGEDRTINGRPAREVLSEFLVRTMKVSDAKYRKHILLDSIYKLRLAAYSRQKNMLAKNLDTMPDGPDRDATKKTFLEISKYLKHIRDRMKEIQ